MTMPSDSGAAPVGPGVGPTPPEGATATAAMPSPAQAPGNLTAAHADLSANLEKAVRAAPALRTDPGTAVSVAAGGGM